MTLLENDHAVPPVESERLHRVGFIATRISGTDGVSLEVGKWDEIFQRLGFDCYYIAGKSDRPEARSFIIPQADFLDPYIADLHSECFGRRTRSAALSSKLHELRTTIKAKLLEAIKAFEIDLLVVQNALTIPLNIPFDAAIVELLAETRIPCILNYHDFYWERDRFLINCVEDYLRAAFPPSLPYLQHVVINSLAGDELSRRTGQPYSVIPNVMNFAHGPDSPDEYASSLRNDLRITEDEILILQPTRVVQRKGIEHAVQLVCLLEGRKAKLVVTHSADD